MKKLTGLIIFIVVLVLIYTGFWFYQAHHVKELVMVHLNEYSKPNADGYHVKVDDVSVHGYPFNYEVRLANPRYEKIQGAEGIEQGLKMVFDGALKIGTDILGRSYWVKQEGDINYIPSNKEDKNSKKYVIKGNLELKADVADPQYTQALMHPFRGLPKTFYKENVSFQEVLNELKMASYEDHNFGVYEMDGTSLKQLIGFSKGWIRWSHNLKGNEDEKFAFNLDLKDFEAVENGKLLLPHLKKLMDFNTDMAMDVPYILASGKNNINVDFEATLPQNFDLEKVFSYKNIDIVLKKLEMDNLYGHTGVNFNINFKENEKDNRNLHVGLNAESLISEKGAEAIHRQFIESLKFQVANQPDNPDNKVLVDLLKCCEDRLQDIIPDYSKLGKMQFIFDADVKAKNVTTNLTLDKIIISHLDALAKPFGIKSHGLASLVDDRISGKYEIEWINYKTMVHDAVAYYNRIYPILEKFSESNNQPLTFGLINETQEKEIEDFFKSISNDPANDHANIVITIDFTDINNLKIGRNTLEQVNQAWRRLISDLKKPEAAPPPQPAIPDVKQNEEPAEAEKLQNVKG